MVVLIKENLAWPAVASKKGTGAPSEATNAFLHGSALELKDYVWKEQERPLVAHNQFDNGELMPVIDMSGVRLCASGNGTLSMSERQRTQTAAAEMARASQEWGFFQIINHGVQAELVKKMETHARNFFEGLKPEEKKQILRDANSNKPMGYACGGLGTRLKNDIPWMESLHLPSSSAEMERYIWRVWKDGNPEFRKVLSEFGEAMEKVSIKVMDMLMDMLPELQEKAYPQSAIAAGGLARMSANRSKAKAGIEKMVGDKRNNSIVRLNYYPPCPQPNLTLGLGVHSDPHLLTLLHQDLVGGLQVFKDGVWIAVRPRPNALIVNIGDALQVASNDIYKSVEHRAVCNSLKSRLSMGFFLTPLDDATISPFASSSSRYRPFTWKEYREQMYANRPRGRSNLLHYRIQNS